MTYNIDRSLVAGNDARDQLAAAVRAALDTCDRWPGHDLPNLLADALVAVATEALDVGVLTRHLPGSPEADAVRRLTVGAQDLVDEKLHRLAAEAGHRIEIRRVIVGADRQSCSCGWDDRTPGAWRGHARTAITPDEE